MPKSRPPYAPELRRRIVEMVRSGRTPEELSREFEPTAQLIRNWVEQAELDEGLRSDGLTTAVPRDIAWTVRIFTNAGFPPAGFEWRWLWTEERG